MAHVRLFIALSPPPPIRREISRCVQELEETRAQVRWEREGKFHCTLKFLGDVEDRTLPDILSRLATAAESSLPARVLFEQVGCFPDLHDPRVIWIGMTDPDRRVAALQQNVEDAMALCGFDRETRPFHAHVTVGRVKGRAHIRELTTRIKSVTFQSREATLAEIELIRSDLRPSGSVYTPLHTIHLGPPDQ